MRTICQLLHGLRVGGAEVLAARIARRLSIHYRFVFVCLDELGTLGEQLRDEGFVVEVLERRSGVDVACSMRLAGFLRRQRVSVVHAHQYTPFFYGVTARMLCHQPAVLFTEHGRHQPDYPRRKRIVANRLLLRKRDRVIGVGEAVRQALIDNEGIPAQRVGVVYNGVDLEPFSNHRSECMDVRREINAAANDLVIIQVARLDYLKDHATAIRTLERVLVRRPDAILVLVGEGPEEAKIRQVARDRGVYERVRFLGLRSDIPRLLAAADQFLLTSVSEGIPVTLIEALAARLPIVSTRVGGVAEVVEDGITGLLAAAGDDTALAEKVLQLAGDPEQCRQLAECGHARAAQLFSERQMHAGYVNLYEEMLRG
ncbi:MAG: glycosyltransferase [Gemmataceae bacterium]|nr:glycosyltransferase [Gemmataceae bacterium]MCI0743373.1 glycosyltransferase [Gemmataceae bacterium]